MILHNDHNERSFAAPPPPQFLHHEHRYCEMRPQIYPDGRVALFCNTHHRHKPSRTFALRVCGDGRLILNVRSPGHCGIQVVKFSLPTGAWLQDMDRLPDIIGRRTRPTLADKRSPEFVGYLRLNCAICPDDGCARLFPTFWAINSQLRQLELMMQCLECGAETIIKLDTEADVDACGCEEHPPARHGLLPRGIGAEIGALS